MNNKGKWFSCLTRIYNQVGFSSQLKKLFGYGIGSRETPIMISLEPKPGSNISNKPPVRIYVGSESSLYRAERLFVWSILQVRDPGRRYEIYLMKDLAGFQRRGWSRSYSGYRYAIPGFVNGQGRAIYNDVTQVYFNDPADLFDSDINGSALISMNRQGSNVLLLECGKLGEIWLLNEVKSHASHLSFDQKANAIGGYGRIPLNWDFFDIATDSEKSTGLYRTKVDDHTEHFSSTSNESKSLMQQRLIELECDANRARFTLFTEDRASARYKELLGFYETMHEVGRPETGHDAKQTFSGVSLTEHIKPVAHLLKLSGAKTVLDFGSGKGKLYHDAPGCPNNSRFKSIPSWGDAIVTCYDPGYQPFSEPVDGPYDVVISTDVVEHIPEEDISWVLDKIFAYARHSVYVVAACYPAHKHLPDGSNAHCTLQAPEWWVGQMQQSAQHYPGVNWVLCTQEKGWLIFQKRKKLRKKGMRNSFFSGKNLQSQEYKSFETIEFSETVRE